jgi:hypothetical protein
LDDDKLHISHIIFIYNHVCMSGQVCYKIANMNVE